MAWGAATRAAVTEMAGHGHGPKKIAEDLGVPLRTSWQSSWTEQDFAGMEEQPEQGIKGMARQDFVAEQLEEQPEQSITGMKKQLNSVLGASWSWSQTRRMMKNTSKPVKKIP